MIVLLEPMYKVTKILSSSLYSTVSDIRLTFTGILRHIEIYIDNHTLEESIIADSIRKKLMIIGRYLIPLQLFQLFIIQVQNYLLFHLKNNVIK